MRTHTRNDAPLRILKLSLALGAAIIWANTAPVTAAPGPLVIKLAPLAPAGTSYDRILKELAERWRKASGGQVLVRVYSGGTQGSEAEVVRRMNVKQLQAAMLTAGGLAEIDPAIAALQEIPMLFRSLDEAAYVRERMRPDLEKRLRARGFVVLFWGDSGWVRLSRKASVRPEDFKGQKILVTASDSTKQTQLFQALGYRPVVFELADALTQMETGNIDAVETLPLYALSSQYYRVTKHMTELNFVPLVGATVVTEDAWEAIPQETRAALMDAAAEAARSIPDVTRHENELPDGREEGRGEGVQSRLPLKATANCQSRSVHAEKARERSRDPLRCSSPKGGEAAGTGRTPVRRRLDAARAVGGSSSRAIRLVQLGVRPRNGDRANGLRPPADLLTDASGVGARPGPISRAAARLRAVPPASRCRSTGPHWRTRSRPQ
jgi:TRAP-type C4-dicarboxylate transport system substrate-binding protein